MQPLQSLKHNVTYTCIIDTCIIICRANSLSSDSHNLFYSRVHFFTQQSVLGKTAGKKTSKVAENKYMFLTISDIHCTLVESGPFKSSLVIRCWDSTEGIGVEPQVSDTSP